jgi:hypothetical protein
LGALSTRRAANLNENALLGWIEPRLVAHDQNAPSLLRRLFQSSSLIRQAVFAALAFDHEEQSDPPVLGPSRPFAADPELSVLLRDGRASDIIGSVYGFVPDGFLGALERCGARPLRPIHYLRLFKIFAAGEERKANALRHIGQITDQSIQIVEELLPVLVDGKVVSRLANRAKARELNECLTFIRRVCSRATDDAISDAIRNLEPHSKVATIITRFARRADLFPRQPFVGDDELLPLDTVEKLIWASRRYRNCLRHQIGRAITGAIGFAEFRNLILEVRPLSDGGWTLVDVHTHANGLVDPDDELAAREKAASLGVPHFIAGASGEGWNAVARIASHRDWLVR